MAVVVATMSMLAVMCDAVNVSMLPMSVLPVSVLAAMVSRVVGVDAMERKRVREFALRWEYMSMLGDRLRWRGGLGRTAITEKDDIREPVQREPV